MARSGQAFSGGGGSCQEKGLKLCRLPPVERVWTASTPTTSPHPAQPHVDWAIGVGVRFSSPQLVGGGRQANIKRHRRRKIRGSRKRRWRWGLSQIPRSSYPTEMLSRCRCPWRKSRRSAKAWRDHERGPCRPSSALHYQQPRDPQLTCLFDGDTALGGASQVSRGRASQSSKQPTFQTNSRQDLVCPASESPSRNLTPPPPKEGKTTPKTASLHLRPHHPPPAHPVKHKPVSQESGLPLPPRRRPSLTSPPPPPC